MKILRFPEASFPNCCFMYFMNGSVNVLPMYLPYIFESLSLETVS